MKRDELPATPIRYLSLFSGIEAATVAWAPLSWVCVGVAEIENFPLRVLAHHYPDVPSLGDITKITEADIAALGRIDVMVFGSPCQDMSVAGKRKGMLNADGTVTRSGLFFAAFNIFQWARKHGGCRFALWENVPGAYSSSQGRDFASVVELLAGLDDVQCPSTAGARKAVRWATMDCSNGHVWTRNGSEWRSGAAACSLSSILETGPVAPQYFLSPKACAGILRRAEKRGKTLPELLHRALAAAADSLIAAAPRDCSSPLYCLAHGQGGAELAIDRSPTLTCNHEAPIVAGDLNLIAFDSRQDCVSSTEVFGSLGSSSPQAQAIAFSCKDHGADATIELTPTMRAMGHAASHANAGGQLAVAFVQNTRDEVRLMNGDGQIVGALSAQPGMKQTCYVATCVTGDVAHCLKAEGFDASEDGTGRGQPIVASVSLRGREGGATAEMGGDLAGTLRASGGGGDKAHALIGMAVRRLTPTETERLQGFPDGYTAIPIKKYARKRVTKLRPESMWAQIDGNWWLLAADGPRYKSHGNSFAVPVINWIGRKIQSAMEAP